MHQYYAELRTKPNNQCYDKKAHRKSTPIFLAFLVMGLALSGPLTSQLQSDFSLNNFQAGLVTFMAFIMFGLLSVPMGLYQDRKGRKQWRSCWGFLQRFWG